MTIKQFELKIGEKKVVINCLWVQNLKIKVGKLERCFGGIENQDDIRKIATWILAKSYAIDEVRYLSSIGELSIQQERVSSMISTVLTFNQGF